MAKIKFNASIPLVDEPMQTDKTIINYANEIALTKAQHDELLAHCKIRLDWAAASRDIATERFKKIDKELYGYLLLDNEDKQRQLDTENGKGPKPYPIFLQLTRTQLSEAITFLMSVFFPEEGPYAATAPADQQDIAKAFTALMNQHSSIYKHYRNFAKFCFDGLRYNIAYMGCDWERNFGTAVTNDKTTGFAKLEERLLYQGNKLNYLDPYNTLVDPGCDPVELAEEGEFFANVKLKSNFQLSRELKRGKIFNVTANYFATRTNTQVATKYYKDKPAIVADNAGGSNKETDWVSILTAGQSNGKVHKIGSCEEVTILIWLDAGVFGLSKIEQPGIYKIRILNGEKIIDIEEKRNAHGLLQIVAIRLWDDNFDAQSSSFAEMLLPYQRFASFQMNVHQHAARKALYGVTFYDENTLPDVKNADMACAKIPFKSNLNNNDINKAFKQIFDSPNTDNTLRDIEFMDGLMQKILPTDILKQVTDLERATEYQSAATVQGANRRNLTIAQLIDAQAMDKCKQMQMYNILEKQEAMKLIDRRTGEVIDINPTEFRDSMLEFIVGAGLRGLDKLILVGLMKEILNSILQNQHAAQTYDTTAIIDYITTMIGDHTNFAQFKFKTEFDKLTPEQKQMAFTLLQQAMQQQATTKAQSATGGV